MVVARWPAQAALARKLGATVVDPFPVEQLLEEAAAWSGGVLNRFEGSALPMAHPGGFDVVYDTVGTAQTAEIGVRLLKQRGTMVKSGVHAPERWEWSPLYFKEISWVGSNAFGVEEVDGVRMHGIAHYLRLASEGRIDMTGMLTHTFRLDAVASRPSRCWPTRRRAAPSRWRSTSADPRSGSDHPPDFRHAKG